MYNLGNAKKNQLGLKEEKNKYAIEEYHVDINSSNDSHSIIAREVLKSNKKEVKVLDIGCGSGVMGEFFMEESRIVLDGIEIDEKAREALKRKGRYRNVYDFSIETIEKETLRKKLDKYDFIIVADLLEHLIKPYDVLENLTELLNKNGIILISIPNIAHIDIIKNLLNAKFNYNNTGTLDTTHLRFFTLKSFAEMIKNINESHKQKLDLELIGETNTFPDNIDYESDLFNILNSNNNMTKLQYIFKANLLPKEEEPKNLEKILHATYKDVYNVLNAKIEDATNLLIDNKELFEENTSLMQENDNLFDELIGIKKENDQLKAIATSLMNSTSWKLTAPLRQSKVLLSKVKNKALRVKAKAHVALDKEEDTKETQLEINSFLRTPINELVNILNEYDVISFDIFDTLIFRKFVNPTDVFQFIGITNKMESFGVNRVKAEMEARKKTKKQNFEINIQDIYEELENYIQIDKEEFIKKEFEMEESICYANPYMKEIFSKLKTLKKPIIITSDMYWPKEYLEKLLKKCGYEGFEDIYVSCDYEKNKGNGSIQKQISKKYPNKNIVHIGDNYQSDFLGSKKAGWSAYHYKSCKEIAQKVDDPIYDNSLVESITSAMRYNYLYAEDKHFTKYYKYGFKYGGILVCGFMEYINQVAKENNIDKILFLARDSKIFYEVYNKYYKEFDNEYTIISRSAMFEINFENNIEEFIDFYFKYRASLGKITFEEALKETDLELLIPKLGNYKLNASEYLTTENLGILKQLIYDAKELITNHFKSSKEAAIEYFKKQTNGCKKVLAVDLGWSGSIVSLMRTFFKNNIDKEMEVFGAFIGNKNSQKVNSLIDLGIFHSFCFAYNKGNNTSINLDSWEGNMQAIFVEAMFTSNEPTLLKYEKNNFIYGNLTSNEKILNEIHKGILDFAKLYTNLELPNKEKIKLNGVVSFQPLYDILTNYKLNYEIFKNFKEYADSLPRFNGDREITTIGKIMKNRNFM